jgi:uncharacterized membrane protein
MKQTKNLYLQALSLGFVSGMRSTFAAAILTHYLSETQAKSLKKSRLSFMGSPIAASVTKLFAGGEVIADKLPSTPSRIKFPGILFRVASGAFAGAVIATNKKESLAKGLLLGSAGAIAGSYACYYLRKYISKIPHVKDAYVGTAEDIAAIGIGMAVMR